MTRWRAAATTAHPFFDAEKLCAPHALVCGALTAGMVLALVCGA
ncbi:MAG: hypothetical protein ACLVJ8_03550 [Ruthenibacterium lactatiformans]